jgi:preprotein translocase subunit SecA
MAAALPSPRLADWPPARLELAARVFAERAEASDTAFDRWLIGLISSVRVPAALRRRAGVSLLRGSLALQEQMRQSDAEQLRAMGRESAGPAFARRDPAAGARALAVVREAARRTVGLEAYPPQLLTAWKLICGRLVELDTGEGKTLSAALAACVAGLAGVPTHVVTVNDYLAQRDAQTMGPLFAFFGVSVGVVHSGVPHARRSAEYARRVTYCTNKDLVFDYLRDRVNARGVSSRAQLAVRKLHGIAQTAEPLRLRGLQYAIVDEADSILIDEGRTPLILSAARERGRDETAYRSLLEVAGRLELGRHYDLIGAQQVPELTGEGRERLETIVARLGENPEALESGTQAGSVLVRDESPREDAAAFWQVAWVRERYVCQALRALHVLKRDQHYVVHDGKIVIVDEFTGRLLPDRSWEQGLHQLVEAKEGCPLTGVNRTLARLTYQAFFARYLRLSGMSGTLREVSRETAAVYRVRTERIEPHRRMRRIVHPSRLLPSEEAKQAAVVAEVRECLARGQPVLVGTRSVYASQTLSAALTAAAIEHRVLNALQNKDEAELVARAGTPGAVTVATNMAGRGTDIPLHPSVLERGGLHVILTEWHESGRIDRQLFGRCARQGDPGSCRAIVSLQDEIIERHAPESARRAARRWSGREPPQWVIRWLCYCVQARAERVNAAQRRATTERDRQMQTQLAFSGVAE